MSEAQPNQIIALMALACLRVRMGRLKYNSIAKEFIEKNIKHKKAILDNLPLVNISMLLVRKNKNCIIQILWFVLTYVNINIFVPV